MKALLDRVLVVLTAAPTWLIAASTVLAIFADEVPGLDPYIAPIIGAIATAVAIIRRVTPVVKGQRGLLPSRLSDAEVAAFFTSNDGKLK